MKRPAKVVKQASGFRRVVFSLAVFSLILLLSLLILHRLNVRLGEGAFAYRYSPVYATRLFRALPAIALAIGAGGAVWMACNANVDRRRAGVFFGGLVALLLVIWTWVGPPNPVLQHTFNFISPSHEGAFLLETLDGKSAGEYLRQFNPRLELSKEALRGTRVLSNPPGATILAKAACSIFPFNPEAPSSFDQWALSSQTGALDSALIPNALRYAIMMQILWGLSGLVAYAVGARFLSPAGALAFMFLVLFNPCAVLFTPGKDPAQLLTINLFLLTGLAGWQRQSVWLSAIAGSALMLGTLWGLIHIWIAVATFSAIGWHTWRTAGEYRALVKRVVLPAGAGGGVVLLSLYLIFGWNALATILAVQRRFGQIYASIQIDQTIWFFIGLPIFLLFTTPVLWTLVSLNKRRLLKSNGFGRRLFLCTIVTMTATYVLGATSELPRVWVAFIPLLALGLMIDLPLFHSRNAWRVRYVVALLVIVQIVFTLLHWSFFDVRESEYRIITQTYFGQ